MSSPLPNKTTIEQFQTTVYGFYSSNGRSFPWRRRNCTPYHILVSELMLQQTQAHRVVPKYQAFIKAFPNFKQLANSSLSTVLTEWQGLGYNRRALLLHQCAQVVTTYHHGQLPRETTTLTSLPGIGPYTAAAIQAFAFNLPAIVIETNIRTVYLHQFFAGQSNITDAQLTPFISATLDHSQPRLWYTALMDYGAQLKKIYPNPSRNSAHYQRQAPFKGSNRQVRGCIIKQLTKNKTQTLEQLKTPGSFSTSQLTTALKQLCAEQLVKKNGTRYGINNRS